MLSPAMCAMATCQAACLLAFSCAANAVHQLSAGPLKLHVQQLRQLFKHNEVNDSTLQLVVVLPPNCQPNQGRTTARRTLPNPSCCTLAHTLQLSGYMALASAVLAVDAASRCTTATVTPNSRPDSLEGFVLECGES